MIFMMPLTNSIEAQRRWRGSVAVAVASAVCAILIASVHQVGSVSNPMWTRSEEFCYDPNDLDCGPSVWPGVCTSGQRQSPIDIDLSSKFTLGSAPGVTLIQFNEAYGRNNQQFFARSTGHSFQVQLTEARDPTSNLRFSGAALPNEYVFGQLHFHWGRNDMMGSEHTLFGKRYPLEMHLVHYKSQYSSLADAMDHENDPEAVAVLAVFFQVDSKDNPALDGIVAAVRSPGATEVHDDFRPYSFGLNIQDLLPQKLHFVRYLGSLTTPPCTENVVWSIFMNSVPISSSQLGAFRQVEDTEEEPFFNFRLVQRRNSRAVKFYKVPAIKRSFVAGYNTPPNLIFGFILQLFSNAKSFLSDLISLNLSWWAQLFQFFYKIAADPTLPFKISEFHII